MFIFTTALTQSISFCIECNNSVYDCTPQVSPHIPQVYQKASFLLCISSTVFFVHSIIIITILISRYYYRKLAMLHLCHNYAVIKITIIYHDFCPLSQSIDL